MLYYLFYENKEPHTKITQEVRENILIKFCFFEKEERIMEKKNPMIAASMSRKTIRAYFRLNLTEKRFQAVMG